ncbi:hypothetical protein AGDE_04090 [Angomonas deanei]|nr:hypothetical protein AGDE_04090 [Angomonas deanei]|eukprot:EPY39838.1 hypothetical protein AGDE_04090 [Angomonas deanei]
MDRLQNSDDNEKGGRNVIHKKVGDLVLEIPKKKAKRLTRKQQKRKEKMVEKGIAVNALLDKKFDRKKRSIKIRAQIRNSELHS